MKTINIYDFSEYPGLRHCNISDDSGEEFYHKILNKSFYKALKNKKKTTVNLDDTAGYAPSFLDEAFGNLIFDFGIDLVSQNLILISNQEPDLIDVLKDETFKEWQDRRKNNNKPKKTKEHESWFSYIDNEFINIS